MQDFATLDFQKTNTFSKLFTDYINREKAIEPFYGLYPDIDSFKIQIEKKVFPQEKRIILHQALTSQYGAFEMPPKVFENIHALQFDNTYTVTTGHQLNIFTGPLYVIYKIITTIQTCKQLKEKYPDYNFVPVYWMASEDHDFEEISSFNLFGHNYSWETDQKGAVGRFRPQALNELISKLPESVSFFEQAYLDFNTLSQSVRKYMNELFGDEGLVTVDGDDKALKELFKPVIIDDLQNQRASVLVNSTSLSLQELGYKTQINPREINFFYLRGNLRERIVLKQDVYEVINSNFKFDETEMLKEIISFPERFSPNVVFRPLYQETILPNLAYVGGPSEISYWLQLKDMFDSYETQFPILMPRNFALLIPKSLKRRIQRFKFSAEELFLDSSHLRKLYVGRINEYSNLIESDERDVDEAFAKIQSKAEQLDKSLLGFVKAEKSKVFKILDNIGNRLKKAEENQYSTRMRQIDTLKDKLFPNGGLQERHDNFLNFYLNDPKFFNALYKHFDAFDFKFLVICLNGGKE